MNRKLSIADDLLLWVVIAVVAVVAFSIVGAIISTVFFALKVFVVVLAIGAGVKVVSAIGSGGEAARTQALAQRQHQHRQRGVVGDHGRELGVRKGPDEPVVRQDAITEHEHGRAGNRNR